MTTRINSALLYKSDCSAILVLHSHLIYFIVPSVDWRKCLLLYIMCSSALRLLLWTSISHSKAGIFSTSFACYNVNLVKHDSVVLKMKCATCFLRCTTQGWLVVTAKYFLSTLFHEHGDPHLLFKVRQAEEA